MFGAEKYAFLKGALVTDNFLEFHVIHGIVMDFYIPRTTKNYLSRLYIY